MQSVLDFLVEQFGDHDFSFHVGLQHHVLKLAGIVFAGYAAYRIYKWPRNLPPGPKNWPIQTAIKKPGAWHLDFVRLGQQYGEIFSFYYGSK